MASRITIKLNQVSKIFKKNTVIDNFCLEVKNGEVMGIMGPNGSGKTTLINLLLGLLTPNFGTIEIFNRPLPKNLEYIHLHTNMVSTYRRLQEEISIYDNLLTYARLYNISNPAAKVNEILHLLNLESYVQQKRKLATLSTGENTRIMFAKALINNPKILYLDEPTASLDPSNTTKIRNIINDIHRQNHTTMVLATHNLEEARLLCNRICFIKKGKIIKIIPSNQAEDLIDLY